MGSGFIKTFLDYLKNTPVHPQWFIFKDNYKSLSEISHYIKGRVLDIGCSNKEARKYLPDDCQYIGLDYYKTATEWYGSYPETYGDAQNLPFKDNSVNSVLLLDVLEHLPAPEKCIREIKRILIAGGVFIIQVPFIYPLHDVPLDFQRWTLFGLRELLKDGFTIIEEIHQGNPLESASLMMNIAICKTILNWIKQKNPAALVIVLLPLIILCINIITKIIGYISPSDALMPWGYRLVLVKN